LSDLPLSIAQRSRCRNAQGRSGSGAVRTVEVELEFETPTDKPPKAGTRYLSRLQKAVPNFDRPAGGVHSGSHCSYSSQGTRTARES
jgi:hypothetical protein